jgi:hypothetical protein
MNKTELRLGNWVQSSSNKEYQINLSWYECCKDSTEGRNIQFDTFPIPLTKEWLIKLGFKKVEDLGDMIYYQVNEGKRGYGVQYNHEEWVFYLYTGNDTTPLIYDDIIFQSVHQLQNLYFALTGEELNKQD